MNFGCFCIYRLVANGISDKIFEEKILQEKFNLHTFPSIKKLLRSQRAQKCNFESSTQYRLCKLETGGTAEFVHPVRT